MFFGCVYRPGPNAPLDWMRMCVEHLVPEDDNEIGDNDGYRRKILLGLNFYGYDYTAQGGGSPILGHQFAQMLQKHTPKILWNEEIAEHYVQIHGYANVEIFFGKKDIYMYVYMNVSVFREKNVIPLTGNGSVRQNRSVALEH